MRPLIGQRLPKWLHVCNPVLFPNPPTHFPTIARIGKASSDDGVVTPERLAELKAERKQRAAAKAEARKPLDKMIKEEIKRLGRKLTQGEKNACSLKVHHPDLVDVWGDLQKRVKVIKPVTMEAHPSLKLTLLPFQKESLYWMRKQEEGPWKGGMLADESEFTSRAPPQSADSVLNSSGNVSIVHNVRSNPAHIPFR